MQFSKHTPGPWQVVLQPKGETGPTRITLKDSTDHYRDEICVLYTNPDGSPGNARLIAAAPVLLNALKAAQKRLCEQCDGSLEEFRGEHSDECLAAMEAIELAEGASHA